MKRGLHYLFAAVLVVAVASACGEKDLEDEIDDVVEEQEEAANRAVRTPRDTARIREEAQDVIEEQKDVQDAVRREVQEQNLPSTTTQE